LNLLSVSVDIKKKLIIIKKNNPMIAVKKFIIKI